MLSGRGVDPHDHCAAPRAAGALRFWGGAVASACGEDRSRGVGGCRGGAGRPWRGRAQVRGRAARAGRRRSAACGARGAQRSSGPRCRAARHPATPKNQTLNPCARSRSLSLSVGQQLQLGVEAVHVGRGGQPRPLDGHAAAQPLPVVHRAGAAARDGAPSPEFRLLHIHAEGAVLAAAHAHAARALQKRASHKKVQTRQKPELRKERGSRRQVPSPRPLAGMLAPTRHPNLGPGAPPVPQRAPARRGAALTAAHEKEKAHQPRRTFRSSAAPGGELG